MIKLNTRYTLIPPAGAISFEGIRLITSWIGQQRGSSPEWQAANPGNERLYIPRLPDDWQWVWETSDGKLTTRVRKFYYKEHGLKCPPSFLTQVGNLGRDHTNDDTVYHFEFVNEFDWYPGDYGDSGSCYWGSNAEAREILADNGALAMLFYDNENAGIARAWVVPMDDYHIVFNGYGFAGHSTLIIARVMSFHLNVTYKSISLRNNGTSDGMLWINGGSGYVVGQSDLITGIRSYDFEWYTSMGSCNNCGDTIVGEDDLYHGPDDMPYCQYCFYELFDYCSQCGGTHWLEDLRTVDDEYYCDWCCNRHCVPCAKCGELVPTRRATERKGRHYCHEHS